MRRRDRRRLLREDAAQDPLAGLVNLFDVWLALVAALLVALALRAPPAPREGESPVDARRREAPRLRPSNETRTGEGRRLGVAYELPGGEVVYVPEGS